MNKYRTVSGDTWDFISYKIYGDHDHIEILIQANIEYLETIVFYGGIELNIPEDIQVSSSKLPPWKRG